MKGNFDNLEKIRNLDIFFVRSPLPKKLQYEHKKEHIQLPDENKDNEMDTEDRNVKVVDIVRISTPNSLPSLSKNSKGY